MNPSGRRSGVRYPLLAGVGLVASCGAIAGCSSCSPPPLHVVPALLQGFAPFTDTAVQDAGPDVRPPSDVKPDLSSGDSPDGWAPDRLAAASRMCPGTTWCACEDGSDCYSGVCLEFPAGKRCTVTCIDQCPASAICAQVEGPDLVYVCVPRWGWLCDPCSSSSQCAGPGHASAGCVRYGGLGGFCGSACDDDEDCDAEYACLNATLMEGETSQQCVKLDEDGEPGACPCSQRAVEKDLSTPCPLGSPEAAQDSNCTGVRKCIAAGEAGLGPCEGPAPVTETCNDADDDCDGLIDDGACGG